MFYHNLLGFYYFYLNVGNPPVVSPAPASTGHDIVPPPATPRRALRTEALLSSARNVGWFKNRWQGLLQVPRSRTHLGGLKERHVCSPFRFSDVATDNISQFQISSQSFKPFFF